MVAAEVVASVAIAVAVDAIAAVVAMVLTAAVAAVVALAVAAAAAPMATVAVVAVVVWPWFVCARLRLVACGRSSPALAPHARLGLRDCGSPHDSCH